MTFVRRADLYGDSNGIPDVTQIYLTRRQVSQMYPISESTLARLASQGLGPVFYKPTDKALYRPQDIEKWIEATPATMSEVAGEGFGRRTGRGKAARSVQALSTLPRVKETVSPGTGRRLKSLTPSSDSWLRREE